jgi:hypothetical protein
MWCEERELWHVRGGLLRAAERSADPLLEALMDRRPGQSDARLAARPGEAVGASEGSSQGAARAARDSPKPARVAWRRRGPFLNSWRCFVSVVPLTPSVADRMEALTRANMVRSGRARLRREVATGRRAIADVISDPPAEARTASVGDVLSWQQVSAGDRAHNRLDAQLHEARDLLDGEDPVARHRLAGHCRRPASVSR